MIINSDKNLQIGQRTARQVGMVAFVSASAKAIIGYLSGSIVLIADSIHSFADTISIFIVWVGLKIAQRKPTEKFHYGFYKVESIASLMVAGLILFASVEIFQRSWEGITTVNELKFPLLAMAIAVVDGLLLFFLGRHEVKIGKKINSDSLVADGRESKMHLLSSGVVLIGVIAAHFQINYLEGITGMVIGLLVLQVGLESLRDAIYSLIDVSPSPEVEREIKTILNSNPGVYRFYDLKLRKTGPFIQGQATIEVEKKINFTEGTEIVEEIENEVRKKIDALNSFSVYVRLFQKEKKIIAIPVKTNQGLDSELNPVLAHADSFLIVKTDGLKIKDFYLIKNPYSQEKMRTGLKTARYLAKEGIDTLITLEIGPIALHALRDEGINVCINQAKTARGVIQELFNQELKKAREATKKR